MNKVKYTAVVGAVGILSTIITSYVYYETSYVSSILLGIILTCANVISLACSVGLIYIYFASGQDRRGKKE